MAEQVYKRLTRGRMTLRCRASLWEGSDHLLFVENFGYREAYKRFYFRDIQAITVQQTSRRAIWNGVLAIPFGVFVFAFIVSMSAPTNTTGMIISSILLGLSLVPIIINNLKGTACTCLLRTAVQTENLGSLSRVRQTHKVLEKIRPLIAAAQGQLTAEEVSARMHQAVLTQPGATFPQAVASVPTLVPAPASEPPVPPTLS